MNSKILIFGDLMIDRHVNVKRRGKSFEANISIYDEVNDFYSLGGSGNVFVNVLKSCKNLEVNACIEFFYCLPEKPGYFDNREDILNALLVELEGNYDSNFKLSDLNFKLRGFRTKNCISIPLKTRYYKNSKMVYRVDSEDISTIPYKLFKNNIFYTGYTENDVIILSDYNKGTITEKLCKDILDKFPGKIFIDPKCDNINRYLNEKEKNSSLFLVPNEKEFDNFCKKLKIFGNFEERLEKLSTLYPVNFVIKRGENGGCIKELEKTPYYFKCEKNVIAKSVVGAGDVFLAKFVSCIVYGMSVKTAFENAVTTATLSVERIGTCHV